MAENMPEMTRTHDHRDAQVAEFDRQVSALLAKGYPQAAGMRRADFLGHVRALREKAGDTAGDPPADGRLPFVLVIKDELVSGAKAIELVERRGEPGFSVIDADDISSFTPIDTVTLPEGPAYLMVDVDTGKDTLNVTPEAALTSIAHQGRSPLTIAEGVALVTQHPEAVAQKHGFSLLGSRCGDRRVAALWISKGRPKLGWCWAGNPHTWLGSASCGPRVDAGGAAVAGPSS